MSPPLPAGAGRLARAWVPIAFALGFFLLWEGIVQSFAVPRYIIPAPSAIFYQFFRNLPRIWAYTLVTGGETLAGFGLAIGTHFVEGYVNPVHLAPAFLGAALFAVSIACEIAGTRRAAS